MLDVVLVINEQLLESAHVHCYIWMHLKCLQSSYSNRIDKDFDPFVCTRRC